MSGPVAAFVFDLKSLCDTDISSENGMDIGGGAGQPVDALLVVGQFQRPELQLEKEAIEDWTVLSDIEKVLGDADPPRVRFGSKTSKLGVMSWMSNPHVSKFGMRSLGRVCATSTDRGRSVSKTMDSDCHSSLGASAVFISPGDAPSVDAARKE